jgi:hypothetical protein
MYMWSVRDLDLGSMINLSTRVNKTWCLKLCKMSNLSLLGIAHQLRSMWYYGFIFLSKQTLQVLWIEMVGFLSQNYITPHNNLVNMTILLIYFSTSISVWIWNKLHASFYLKNVMNMSLLKIFRWSVVHRAIVHQEEITGMNWV